MAASQASPTRADAAGSQDAAATIAGAPRIAAVDAMRGLVLMILLPDLAGGFSFYRMAEAHPRHPVWEPLAAQFRHVEWSGMAIWDMVMPLFVFLIGVAMALSAQRREARGESSRAMLVHAWLRSATLIVLGLLLQLRPASLLDESLPLIVLASTLPMASPRARLGLRIAVLAFSVGWMASHLDRLGHYEIGNQILLMAGLAYMPAFLLRRCRVAVQAGAMAGILAAYGLAFILYEMPGAVPVGESYTGLFGHWNNGTNLAAALDRWLFGLLPRSDPYTGNPHGYHTLEFVPLVVVILAGVMAGNALIRGVPARRFALVGLAGVGAGWLLAQTLFPLVKSLWTPSWTVWSTSWCVLVLAAALAVCPRERPAFPLRALMVLGTNSILLYVLAYTERWRITSLWHRILGSRLVESIDPWPVMESVLVLLTLWLIGYALFRARIFMRV